jgi:hypothetical protein
LRPIAVSAVAALVSALAGCPDPGVAGAVASASSAGGAGTAGAAVSSSSSGGSAGAGGAPSCADDLPTGADGLGLYDQTTKHFYLLRPGGGTSDFSVGPDTSNASAYPIAGRWTGGAFDHLGLYQPETSEFRLRVAENSNPPALVFNFGAIAIGTLPCAGDWGDGAAGSPPSLDHSGIGVYVRQTAVANMKKANAAGAADYTFSLGVAGNDFLPVAGDWDHSGTDSLALYVPRSVSFFVKNKLENGAADDTVDFVGAQSEWLPVAGDWDADGTDDLGLYDRAASEFHLRLSKDEYKCIQFGEPKKERYPIAGNWQP